MQLSLWRRKYKFQATLQNTRSNETQGKYNCFQPWNNNGSWWLCNTWKLTKHDDEAEWNWQTWSGSFSSVVPSISFTSSCLSLGLPNVKHFSTTFEANFCWLIWTILPANSLIIVDLSSGFPCSSTCCYSCWVYPPKKIANEYRSILNTRVLLSPSKWGQLQKYVWHRRLNYHN